MRDAHLTAELLDSLLSEDRTEEENRLLLHHLAVCPDCYRVGGYILDLYRAGSIDLEFSSVDLGLGRSRLEAPALREKLCAKAEEAFARVAAWWSVGAEADPAGLLDEVRVLALMAALRTAQRRYLDALAIIDRALDSSPEELLRCRLLVSKAKALEESGEPNAAISYLEKAALLVERDQDPRLYLCIRHNMVCLLAHRGRADEAKRLLPEAVDLSRVLGTVLGPGSCGLQARSPRSWEIPSGQPISTSRRAECLPNGRSASILPISR